MVSTYANILSIPSVSNMKKNKKDQIGGTGICRTASGYAMKANAEPLDTISSIPLPVFSAMNPKIANITKPAKKDVPLFITEIIIASLWQLLLNLL